MTQPAGGDAQSFPCSQCGAKLAYDAGVQAMKCPYCGHQQAVQTRPQQPQYGAGPYGPGYGPQAEVRRSHRARNGHGGAGARYAGHHHRLQGLRRHRERGPGRAHHRLRLLRLYQVLQAHTNEQAIRPESLVPFKLNKQTANDMFGKWLAGLWFRPNDLRKLAKVQEMGGVYVPFWTFDSWVISNWTAERGWHYYVTETYTAYENGQHVTRTAKCSTRALESAGAIAATFSTTSSSAPARACLKTWWPVLDLQHAGTHSPCTTSQGGAPKPTRWT